MTTLTQCDRCKRIDKSKSDYKTLEITEEDRRWELCSGCERDFHMFMRNVVCPGRDVVTEISKKETT